MVAGQSKLGCIFLLKDTYGEREFKSVFSVENRFTDSADFWFTPRGLSQKLFLFFILLLFSFQRPQCIVDHHEVVTHISCCCSNHLAASSCYQVAQLAVRTVITLLWLWQMVWSITFQVQFQMVSTGFLPDRYMEWIRTWSLNRW